MVPHGSGPFTPGRNDRDGYGRDRSASHYDRIGGASSVKAAVELFYDKVLADPVSAAYFTDVDMAGQRRHLALMLTMVLGGPNEYTGRGWPRRTSHCTSRWRTTRRWAST
ncbi:group 1 truncated hemoglobin [Micromonospora sp. M12]